MSRKDESEADVRQALEDLRAATVHLDGSITLPRGTVREHTDICARYNLGEPAGYTETCICDPHDFDNAVRAGKDVGTFVKVDYAGTGLIVPLEDEDRRPMRSVPRPEDSHDAVDASGGSRPTSPTRKSLRMAANGSQRRFQRPDWDTWAMGIAEAVSRRADCTRRQVGAVILDPEHRIVATGYNGYPSGAPGCASSGACPRGRFTHEQIPPDSPYVGNPTPCEAIHAEENAVLHAGSARLAGCTVYVTHAPCPNCARLLAGTGIVRVVFPAEGDALGEMKFLPLGR
jgi:dCMP deaminase